MELSTSIISLEHRSVSFLLDSFNLEDGPNKLSRNVGNQLHYQWRLINIPEELRSPISLFPTIGSTSAAQQTSEICGRKEH